jgi:hypothetical protein
MPAKIWIGQFAKRVVVYDSEMQPKGGQYVYLWDSSTQLIEQYVAEISRQVFSRVIDTTVSDQTLAAYNNWKAVGSADWLAQVEAMNGSAAAAERALTERHMQRLQGLGLPYRGVRMATTFPRIAHCYACKAKLDNKVDVECVVCSWILCTCGACGCGYAESQVS